MMDSHYTLSVTALFGSVVKMNYWLKKKKRTLAWPVVYLELKYGIISSTSGLIQKLNLKICYSYRGRAGPSVLRITRICLVFELTTHTLSGWWQAQLLPGQHRLCFIDS